MLGFVRRGRQGSASRETLISIVVPTISERRHWLARCMAAYGQTTPGDFEFIVLTDRPTCCHGWNEGIQLARGEYIHLTCDDIEPLPGWAEAAIRSVDAGELPAARVLNSDGTLQSCGTDGHEHPEGEEASVARLPFASRRQLQRIGPIIERHYMGDYWFSHRGRQLRMKTIVRRDFAFVHHLAPEGRMETLDADIAYYNAHVGR